MSDEGHDPAVEAYKRQLEEQLKLQQQIQMLEDMVKRSMTREAVARYGNIKSAHPEMALKLITILGQAISSSRLQGQITDEQLKEILQQLQSPKHEFKVRRV